MLKKFVSCGYATVPTDLPDSYHRQIHHQLAAQLSEREESGMIQRVPDLHVVFDQPPVRAALTEILGPRYLMNPHAYCHLSQPGSTGHAWHKDSYILDANTRHPRPRWVMALYSPQHLTEDLGPTTFLPGWQYHADLEGFLERAEPRAIAAAPGTVTLLHSDMWHGALPNRGGVTRFVVKLLFERRWDPVGAARAGSPPWQSDDDDRVPLLSMDVWRWMHGEHAASSASYLDDDGQAEVLLDLLDRASEHTRLRAAYALGRFGPSVIARLVTALRRDAIDEAEAVGTRNPSDPKGVNRTALHPAQALSAIGGPATAALVELAHDPDWYVRATAADTLGDIGPAAAAATPALARLAEDAHGWVRRNAVEALGRIGAPGDHVAAALLHGLADSDARVRLNAAVALGKLAVRPSCAAPALRRVVAGDDDRFIRYYAQVALSYAEARDLDDDTGPVRSGWSTMEAVAA
jgi:HEAT repeat protein